MRHPLRALSVAGLAFAGLIGGHAVAYWLTVPDAQHRSTLYAQTGHGYLPSVSWIAVVLGLSALAAGFAHGFVVRKPDRRGHVGRAVASMAGLQVSAFLFLEVFERLASGSALTTLSVGLLVAGLVVQVLVALAGGLVLAGLRKLGRALRGARFETVAPTGHVTLSRTANRGPRTTDRATCPVRGPPSLRAA